MNVVGVTVEVKRMVSDGNYGHETAQVSYTAELEDGEDPEAATIVLLARAKSQVIVQLKNSESVGVRRAVTPPQRLCRECGEELGDYDMGYHDACREAGLARAGVLPAHGGRMAESQPSDDEDSPF